MRLLLDQNLPLRAAVLLRDRGLDCLHVGEVSLYSAEDPEIIAWAESEGRVCITRDTDFHALLATRGSTGPSVIRIRIESLTPAETANLIELACERYRDFDAGALLTITPGKIRCRRLPIGD